MINSKFFKTLCLFIFGVLGLFLTYSYIQNQNIGPSILITNFSRDNLETHSGLPLNKGDKITAKFESKFDYLGTVSFGFDTQSRINKDVLEFRIKEENSPEWYYKNFYNTDQIQNNQLFPFGFPPIKDSQGKTYLFEIESLGGTEEYSISLAKGASSPFISKHQFPLSKLKPIEVFNYFPTKILNLLGDKNFNFYLIAYFSPVLILIFSMIFKKQHILFVLVLVGIFFDSFFLPQHHSDFLIITILLFWLFYSYKNKLKPEVGILIATVLLVIIALLDKSKFLSIQKISIWIYLLFVSVIFQKIILALKRQEPVIGIKHLYHALTMETVKFLKLVKKYLRFIFGVDTPSPKFQKYFFTLLYLGLITLLLYIFYQQFLFIISEIKFYKIFFPEDGVQRFLSDAGFYLLFSYSLFVIAVILVNVRFKLLTTKIIMAIFVSLILLQIHNHFFNTTTSNFKSQIIIMEVYPSKATLWDEVTIEGVNFKELPFAGKVLIDDQEQRILVWDENKIIFITDPTKTKSGNLKVRDKNGKESNTIKFEYYDFNTKELIQ